MTDILFSISQKIAACQKCPDLCNRKNSVPGNGNPNAELVLLGEAPGGVEDSTGIPFVGPAGTLLNNALKVCGWDRSDVFVMNTLCCRPPNNRFPKEEEMANCWPFHWLQLRVIKPRAVALLGAAAISRFLGSTSVGAVRGSQIEFAKDGFKTTLFPLYHPSYYLPREGKEPPDKQQLVEDLWSIRKFLQ